MERLWITQPARTTCLAEVTDVAGDWFAVDKALFAPRSSGCRHPQNHDQGTIWREGEKRRLRSVREDGKVWYALRGTVPEVGETLQCQLNQNIRDLASRAHTAMHLWLAHLPGPPMVADPEIKGGGHFRITYAWPVGADALAQTLRDVQASVASDLEVERMYVEKANAGKLLSEQLFDPPSVPGPESLPIVTIGAHCLPCDGTHVARTSKVGKVVVSHAAQGKDGFVVGGRVV